MVVINRRQRQLLLNLIPFVVVHKVVAILLGRDCICEAILAIPGRIKSARYVLRHQIMCTLKSFPRICDVNPD